MSAAAAWLSSSKLAWLSRTGSIEPGWPDLAIRIVPGPMRIVLDRWCSALVRDCRTGSASVTNCAVDLQKVLPGCPGRVLRERDHAGGSCITGDAEEPATRLHTGTGSGNPPCCRLGRADRMRPADTGLPQADPFPSQRKPDRLHNGRPPRDRPGHGVPPDERRILRTGDAA